MVKFFSRHVLFFGAALFAVHCNMEVGNPESEFAEIGRAQSTIRSLDFQLAAKQPCTTTASDCTAVPVVLADGADAAYTFEMTQAHLQLNALELKPYSAENILTRVDLLKGTQVPLSQAVESSAVTGVYIIFAGSGMTQVQTLSLRGNLIVNAAGKIAAVPLELNFAQSITASSLVKADSSIIQSAQFDAQAWFNLTEATASAAKLLNNLSSGPCSDALSRSCAYYQDALARLIGERISKSLSIKTKPIDEKAVTKGKTGG